MNIFTFSQTLGGVCLFFVYGVSAVDPDRASVSVMEGDTVTLHTGVEMNQRDRMYWYFGEDRLAIINGDEHEICEDVECKERFRDRLKLDHQTGSLTIMNITITDSGEYRLKNTTDNTDNIYSVNVHGVPAAERDEIKRKSVKEGESVTVDTHVIKNLTDVMRLYLNDVLITEITGDQSKICTDAECKERFRDRLKLNNQTGSLTIMNTRNTDSGEYHLQINSSRVSISRNFTVTFPVSSPPSTAGEGTNATDIGGVIGAVVGVALLIVAVPFVIYYCCKRSKTKQEGTTGQDNPRERIPESVNLLTKQKSNGSATDQTVANGSATDQTVANGSATDQTVANGSATDQTVANGSATDQTVVEISQ